MTPSATLFPPHEAATPRDYLYTALSVRVKTSADVLFKSMFIEPELPAQLHKLRSDTNLVDSPWVTSKEQLPQPQFCWEPPAASNEGVAAHRWRKIRFESPPVGLATKPFNNEETQLCVDHHPGRRYIVELQANTSAPYGDKFDIFFRTTIHHEGPGSCLLHVIFHICWSPAMNRMMKGMVSKAIEGGIRGTYKTWRQVLEGVFKVEDVPEATILGLAAPAHPPETAGTGVAAAAAAAHHMPAAAPVAVAAGGEATKPIGPLSYAYNQLVWGEQVTVLSSVVGAGMRSAASEGVVARVMAAVVTLALIHALVSALHSVQLMCTGTRGLFWLLCLPITHLVDIPDSLAEVVVSLVLVAAVNYTVIWAAHMSMDHARPASEATSYSTLAAAAIDATPEAADDLTGSPETSGPSTLAANGAAPAAAAAAALGAGKANGGSMKVRPQPHVSKAGPKRADIVAPKGRPAAVVPTAAPPSVTTAMAVIAAPVPVPPMHARSFSSGAGLHSSVTSSGASVIVATIPPSSASAALLTSPPEHAGKPASPRPAATSAARSPRSSQAGTSPGATRQPVSFTIQPPMQMEMSHMANSSSQLTIPGVVSPITSPTVVAAVLTAPLPVSRPASSNGVPAAVTSRKNSPRPGDPLPSQSSDGAPAVAATAAAVTAAAAATVATAAAATAAAAASGGAGARSGASLQAGGLLSQSPRSMSSKERPVVASFTRKSSDITHDTISPTTLTPTTSTGQLPTALSSSSASQALSLSSISFDPNALPAATGATSSTLNHVFGAQYPPGAIPPAQFQQAGGQEPMKAWIKSMSDSLDAMAEGFKGALGIKPGMASVAEGEDGEGGEGGVVSKVEVEEEVFENERFQPFRGWGHMWPGHFLPSDRVGHWSDATGGPGGSASMIFEQVEPPLPPDWHWLDEEWQLDMEGLERGAVDDQGWTYALDFNYLQHPPEKGCGKCTLKHFVRRRRWFRTRVRLAPHMLPIPAPQEMSKGSRGGAAGSTGTSPVPASPITSPVAGAGSPPFPAAVMSAPPSAIPPVIAPAAALSFRSSIELRGMAGGDVAAAPSSPPLARSNSALPTVAAGIAAAAPAPASAPGCAASPAGSPDTAWVQGGNMGAVRDSESGWEDAPPPPYGSWEDPKGGAGARPANWSGQPLPPRPSSIDGKDTDAAPGAAPRPAATVPQPQPAPVRTAPDSRPAPAPSTAAKTPTHGHPSAAAAATTSSSVQGDGDQGWGSSDFSATTNILVNALASSMAAGAKAGGGSSVPQHAHGRSARQAAVGKALGATLRESGTGEVSFGGAGGGAGSVSGGSGGRGGAGSTTGSVVAGGGGAGPQMGGSEHDRLSPAPSGDSLSSRTSSVVHPLRGNGQAQ